MMATQAAVTPIYPNFPDSDGDPMPERDSHQLQVRDLRLACEQVLRPLPRVHVGGTTFVYFNPTRQADNVAPDIYVALDVPRRRREKYQTWDEGKFPELIFEILSPKTRKDDLGVKKDLYARLGAREYVVFDPRWELRRRTFEVWRLVDGVYLPIPREYTGGIFSTVLGAELRVIEDWLRVIDPATRQPVPTPDEMAALREQAEQRVADAVQARQLAEEQGAEQRARDAAALRAAEQRITTLEAKLALLRASDQPEQGRDGHE